MRSTPTLGVLFNPSLDATVASGLHGLGHVAIIPDRAWIDRGLGAADRFEMLPLVEQLFDDVAVRRPMPLHGIGLSIGSADLFDTAYARQLAVAQQRFGSPWVSEHLSFSRFGSGHDRTAALAIALPYDEEVLDVVTPRVEAMVAMLPCPFLLENSVSYLDYPEQDMTEPEFLNRLCARTGCGILLDLHNVYCNAANRLCEASAYLAELDLDRVVEVHVAGGIQMQGMHTDSHTGPVPEAVWGLLSTAMPRLRHLRAVTFEFHESSFGLLGEAGVRQQLIRMEQLVAGVAP